MKTLIISISLLFAISMTACKKEKDPVDPQAGGFLGGVENNTITIVNNSGNPVYVYDWDMSLDTAIAITPVNGGNPLNGTAGKGDTLLLTMQKASRPSVAARRIYISDKELNNSLNSSTNPASPDPFNYNVDATAQYSFVEYNYNDPSSPASSNSYTIDLSYIDEYSYPLSLKFSNVGAYTSCVEGHEYGITSMLKLKQELKSLSPTADRVKYAWDALIWPDTVKCEWNSSDYPKGMVRVIGPNKVWSENPHDYISGNWVPDSYLPFVQSLPKTGNQLFGGQTASTNNWTGWDYWDYTHNPSPSSTGYVQALHSAANKDSNGKYGFFCYPRDNTDGEFTYVPDAVNCTVTVYSLSN